MGYGPSFLSFIACWGRRVSETYSQKKQSRSRNLGVHRYGSNALEPIALNCYSFANPVTCVFFCACASFSGTERLTIYGKIKKNSSFANKQEMSFMDDSKLEYGQRQPTINLVRGLWLHKKMFWRQSRARMITGKERDNLFLHFPFYCYTFIK